MTKSKLNRLLVTLITISILGIIFIFMLNDNFDNDSIRKAIIIKVGESLIELIIVTLFGITLKQALEEYNKDKEEQKRNHQERVYFLKDLTSQLSEANKKVRLASDLICANRSAKTYGEQLRILMLVRFSFSDMNHEIGKTENIILGKQEVVNALTGIVHYLNELVEEYKNNYKNISEAQVESNGKSAEIIWNQIKELPVLKSLLRVDNDNAMFENEYLQKYFKVKDNLFASYQEIIRKKAI